MDGSNGDSHFKHIIRDFLCGTFAGVWLTLVGHPFDSIKVRMQMASTNITMTQTIKSIYKNEGIFSFYKGMTPPLTTIPLINAIVMTVFEFGMRTLNLNEINAGILAGFVNSFVISPIELVKWRLQMQTESKAKRYYKNPIDCVKKIIKYEGTKTLMTSGLIATIFRETACNAGQFGGYHYSKKAAAYFQDIDVEELGYFSMFLWGGMGGFFWWLSSYPQDIIKTHLQTQPQGKVIYPPHPTIPDEGIIDCTKQIYNKEGFRGFWKGFSAWTVRAFWANAVMFMSYEYAKEHIVNHI